MTKASSEIAPLSTTGMVDPSSAGNKDSPRSSGSITTKAGQGEQLQKEKLVKEVKGMNEQEFDEMYAMAEELWPILFADATGRIKGDLTSHESRQEVLLDALDSVHFQLSSGPTESAGEHQQQRNTNAGEPLPSKTGLPTWALATSGVLATFAMAAMVFTGL